ncbi:MAG: winged helix-turn-helix domain-containing protein [Mariniphaga sp.]|nr:winged helix-turn-helix domain-containing protein [Mariniphaga sp.]
MKTPNIKIEDARRIAVYCQLLNGKKTSSKGEKNLIKIFDQLGYIQIDTISVVNRAHHHALWTRSHDYTEEMLHHLQATDRKIYEYWGHAMSYLRMADFRYSLPRMEKFRNPKSPWAKTRIEKTKNIIGNVKKRIQDEGPLSSKDFENTSGKKGGTWWDWKPAKIALEIMYWQGELMVSERKKFQKYHDLTDRVLPENIDISFPTEKESAWFIIHGALKSFGIASEKEIRNFMQPGSSRDSDFQLVNVKEIKKYLNELIEAGEIIKVKIEDIDTDYFMLAKFEKLPENKNSAIRLLSPFDNLIIQRERTRQLFGYDYSLECYTLEPKRKFGYFVFPILYGNKLVGRLDPKADRKNKILILKNLVFEPTFKVSVKFLNLFSAELKQFAVFNNCEKIIIEKCPNQKMKKELELKFKPDF